MSYWPQYVYLALCFFGLGITIAQHGQPRKDENAWSTLIASAIVLALLYFGGFFNGMFQ